MPPLVIPVYDLAFSALAARHVRPAFLVKLVNVRRVALEPVPAPWELRIEYIIVHKLRKKEIPAVLDILHIRIPSAVQNVYLAYVNIPDTVIL